MISSEEVTEKVCSLVVFPGQLQEPLQNVSTPEPALDQTPEQCCSSNEEIVDGVKSAQTEKRPQRWQGDHHQIDDQEPPGQQRWTPITAQLASARPPPGRWNYK